MGLSLFDTGLSIFTDKVGVLTVTNDGTVTTIMGLSGDYNRIGDAGTTSHSLDSEDDWMITGEGEVKGAFWVDGAVAFASTLAVTSNINSANGYIQAGGLFYAGTGFQGKNNNQSSLLFNISVAGTDSTTHDLDLQIDANTYLQIRATGDGAGGVTTPLITTSADLHMGSGLSIIGDGAGANGIILKNPKNAAASALSGTQLDVEIDIGGTPYHFTVYPTKA